MLLNVLILYINTKIVSDFVSVHILVDFIQLIGMIHSPFLLDKHRSVRVIG